MHVLCTGIQDSSGIRLWYTSSPRKYEAGILEVGHAVSPRHIIPPNSENFTTTGLVTEECTRTVSYNYIVHKTCIISLLIF